MDTKVSSAQYLDTQNLSNRFETSTVMLADAKFSQALLVPFRAITRISLPTIMWMVFCQVSHDLIAADLGDDGSSRNRQGLLITPDDGLTGI